MTINDFENELVNLRKDFAIKEKELLKKYADNCGYSIGDNFTDHIGSIIITNVTCVYLNGKPEVMFFGIELKKDMTPKKSENKRYAYLSNKLN